jgi:putative transposase
MPLFKSACLIEAHTYKTKTDAWNGYHLCPLHVDDRHMTMFITEEGQFRYRVAPQGFVASSDGYNARYDEVLAEVPRKAKCVDDLALWDKDLATHWWRIIDHLEMISKNGIILNGDKFQFCADKIEFAGFRVTNDGVLPLGKYLDSIRNFCRPENITDIRSYFGLVNQVAHYAKLKDMLLPFRVLLTPKTKFFWNEELEKAFEASKLEIVEAIKDRVKVFDLDRKTVQTGQKQESATFCTRSIAIAHRK